MNSKTRDYFGYNMNVEAADRNAGTYRVIFSALTLTPEEMKLPDPGSWHMLPAPVFPPPQIVSTSDTITVALFENPATGQKVVDHIRLTRDGCGAGPTTCLDRELENARQSLTQTLASMESSRDPATIASIKGTQRSWEKYRDAACANLPTEEKRLQCELKLTRSRIRELGELY